MERRKQELARLACPLLVARRHVGLLLDGELTGACRRRAEPKLGVALSEGYRRLVAGERFRHLVFDLGDDVLRILSQYRLLVRTLTDHAGDLGAQVATEGVIHELARVVRWRIQARRCSLQGASRFRTAYNLLLFLLLLFVAILGLLTEVRDLLH